ncbi:MAG: peptide chain release factor N(5)-glutamine methyltransferase [Armatimonadota bacterium]|nr:peptide chain release factor N(5)-glutamine methyltransferase [Armatimonadota bacterium]
MTIAEAWLAGREHLAACGVAEAAITAEVLLRHVLGMTRTELYLRWDRPVDNATWDRYCRLLDERSRGRPVAYITGSREFMGLDFAVDERVLIPRPETEVLVEMVLAVARQLTAPVLADVGTGSGAIAVSLAVRRPDALVIATDLSADALEVARGNAVRHGVAGRMRFLCGDLLAPLRGEGLRVDVLACNPPYVGPTEAAALPCEIREFEPAIAVLAPEGESFHARLVDEAPGVLKPGGWLIMEVAAGQAPRVVELVKQSGHFELPRVCRDGLGWERVVAARVLPEP